MPIKMKLLTKKISFKKLPMVIVKVDLYDF